MGRKIGIAVVVTANVLIAVFGALAYFAFTSNMVVRTGAGVNAATTDMAYGGLAGAFFRYGFVVVAALLLQGIVAVFNLAVFPFLEPDAGKSTRWCATLAFLGFLLMSGLACLLIAFNLRGL